jgi:hypothetical protein
LKINEQVEARKIAIDYGMEIGDCPNGGTYQRCAPDLGNTCDIHAQIPC